MKKSETNWIKKAYRLLPLTDARRETIHAIRSERAFLLSLQQFISPSQKMGVKSIQRYSTCIEQVGMKRRNFANRFLFDIDRSKNQIEKDQRIFFRRKKCLAKSVEKSALTLLWASDVLDAIVDEIKEMKSRISPLFSEYSFLVQQLHITFLKIGAVKRGISARSRLVSAIALYAEHLVLAGLFIREDKDFEALSSFWIRVGELLQAFAEYFFFYAKTQRRLEKVLIARRGVFFPCRYHTQRRMERL